MDEKLCVICMDDNPNSNIIEYNHCGKYFVHESCNDKWLLKNKTCFICRKNIINDNNNNESQIENEDFITLNIVNNNETQNNYCMQICCFFSAASTGLFVLLFLLLL